jgi:hypothetical protein
MKQTAVEWLHEQLTSTWYDGKSSKGVLEIAKEMEKEQMCDTWVDSRTFDKGDNYFGKQKSFDEYYNVIYGDK